MELILILTVIFSMALIIVVYARRDFRNEIEFRKYIAFAITVLNLTLFSVMLKLGDIIHILKEIKP